MPPDAPVRASSPAYCADAGASEAAVWLPAVQSHEVAMAGTQSIRHSAIARARASVFRFIEFPSVSESVCFLDAGAQAAVPAFFRFCHAKFCQNFFTCRSLAFSNRCAIIALEHMFDKGAIWVRTILHSDLNNFYASVECLKDPALKKVPMAVCGDPAARHGIILSKNELAKTLDRVLAEAIWQAKEKCPELVLVGTDFPAYLRCAEKMRHIYADFSDRVEPFGVGRGVAGRERRGRGRQGDRRRDPRAGERGAGADAVGGGIVLQGIRQAGQRFEKAGRHHLRDGGELPRRGLAAAGARPALRGTGHRAAAARAQHTHHRRHRRPPSGNAARHAGQARRAAMDVCQRAGVRNGRAPGRGGDDQVHRQQRHPRARPCERRGRARALRRTQPVRGRAAFAPGADGARGDRLHPRQRPQNRHRAGDAARSHRPFRRDRARGHGPVSPALGLARRRAQPRRMRERALPNERAPSRYRSLATATAAAPLPWSGRCSTCAAATGATVCAAPCCCKATLAIYIPTKTSPPSSTANRSPLRHGKPAAGGSAASQRLRLEVDADPPHAQGAGLLRFVPVGAAVGADGGRPTSRGRPPTAFFGDGERGEMVAVPQKGAGGAGGQRLRLEVDADPPHEQGAGLLRFVPVGAAVGADGGRPTSRGRPPTAFFGGRGARGNGRCSSKGGRRCRRPAPSARS